MPSRQLAPAAAGPPPRPRPPSPLVRRLVQAENPSTAFSWASPPIPTPVSLSDVSDQGCVRECRSVTHTHPNRRPLPPQPSGPELSPRQAAAPRGPSGPVLSQRQDAAPRGPRLRQSAPPLAATHAGRRHWTVAAWRHPPGPRPLAASCHRPALFWQRQARRPSQALPNQRPRRERRRKRRPLQPLRPVVVLSLFLLSVALHHRAHL